MFFRSLAFFLVLALANSDELKREENVIVLTKDNIDSTLQTYEHVLVEFYAPWCGHCKALAPEYAKAAGQLKEEESAIQLAKVDATEETELAEKHHIQGYPTIKFFHKGKAMEYNGGRTSEEIIRWLKKKTGPPAKDLASVDEAKELIDSAEVVIIGYFKNKESDKAKIYLEVAADNDEIPFGITSDEALMKEHGSEDGSVILYKKFDEGKNHHTAEVTKESLSQFIKSNSMPLVVDFNHQSAKKIFGGDIKFHNLLFVSKSSPGYKETLATFSTVAKEFRGKVLFVTIDTDEEDHDRIIEFFGLKKEDTPDLRLIGLQEEMVKFRPAVAGDLSEKAIKDFVTGVLDGSIKPHYLSQDLPEDWDKHPVKVLVQTNFDEVAFDKSKDVLVEFYAPWCGHCKQLAPIYDQLGEKFKDHPSILIAKLDATANELEHTKINSFPTIKLYKKDTNEVVDYNGVRALDGLTRFLETGGEYGKGPSEEELEDEEDSDDDEADTKKDEL